MGQARTPNGFIDLQSVARLFDGAGDGLRRQATRDLETRRKTLQGQPKIFRPCDLAYSFLRSKHGGLCGGANYAHRIDMNANEAIAAAENRKVHLTNLMVQQKCDVPK